MVRAVFTKLVVCNSSPLRIVRYMDKRDNRPVCTCIRLILCANWSVIDNSSGLYDLENQKFCLPLAVTPLKVNFCGYNQEMAHETKFKGDLVLTQLKELTQH